MSRVPETVVASPPVALHGVVPSAPCTVQRLHGNRGSAVNADQPSTGDQPAHGGPRGFTNLILTKRDGEIELKPHATGGCVIVLDGEAATDLFNTIGEWLG